MDGDIQKKIKSNGDRTSKDFRIISEKYIDYFT